MGAAVRALPSIGDPRDAEIARLAEHVVFLVALCRSLNDRIAALEGNESEPDLSGSTMIKEAARTTGYSKSGIRKRIASGKITAIKRGGYWFVDPASLMSKVRSG
jgi:hypothetical protein